MPLYFQYSHHQQLYSALVERLKRINRRETEKPFQTAEAGETNTAVKQGCVRTCSIRTYMNGYTYQEFIVLSLAQVWKKEISWNIPILISSFRNQPPNWSYELLDKNRISTQCSEFIFIFSWSSTQCEKVNPLCISEYKISTCTYKSSLAHSVITKFLLSTAEKARNGRLLKRRKYLIHLKNHLAQPLLLQLAFFFKIPQPAITVRNPSITVTTRTTVRVPFSILYFCSKESKEGMSGNRKPHSRLLYSFFSTNKKCLWRLRFSPFQSTFVEFKSTMLLSEYISCLFRIQTGFILLILHRKMNSVYKNQIERKWSKRRVKCFCIIMHATLEPCPLNSYSVHDLL